MAVLRPAGQCPCRRAFTIRAIIGSLLALGLAAGGFAYVVRLYLNAGAGLAIIAPRDDPKVMPQEAAKGPLVGFDAKDHITCMAFSPDGTMLALGTVVTADEIRTMPTDIIKPSDIKLWDATTRRSIGALKGHDRGINGVAFSRDGKTLASYDFGGTVKLWDIDTRRERVSWKLPTDRTENNCSLSFSPDLKTYATGSSYDEGLINLWDVATQSKITLLGRHATQENPYVRITGLAFSPDGKYLATSDADAARREKTVPRPGQVKVWDVAAQKEVARFAGGADQGRPWPGRPTVALSRGMTQTRS